MFLADSMLVIFCKKGNLLAPQKWCEDKIGVGEVESKNTVIIRVALSNWKIKIMYKTKLLYLWRFFYIGGDIMVEK
jgi:hypothetical protein